MEQLYARNQGSDVDPPTEWPETGLEESMWRLGLSGRETYPERPGVSDCVYYMRTGFCGFGTRCRYNHPRDRAAAVAAARLVGGEFPERPGEPICQYYLKTGTCKFGTTCKFHHPRNAGGSLTNALPNIHGYPLRPGEKECSYYLKTGQCKFGITCKFHHPQPAGMSMPMPAAAPPFYPTVRSPSIPVPEQPAGSPPSYRVARPPLVPGSYVPGSYGPVLLSPGVVPMPGWGSYSGPLSPALSPGGQPGAGGGSVYGVSPLSPSTPGLTGSYNLSSSGGQSITGTTEHKFPERPGEPECQYYLKTGNCKFGSSCKYHHPPDLGSSSVCFLGPLGLPLRPGTQPCTFYMQNGYCKFGPTCKFDHPVGMMKYSPSASSLAETPVGQYMAGSSMVALPLSSSSQDLLPDYALGSQRDTQSTRTLPSGTTSTGLTLIQSTSSINTQRSGQSSALLTSNRSLGEDDEVHHSS